MSARSSSAATGVLVVLLTTAGCDATPQQQSGALSNTADQVFSLIARAVQQELRPVVDRLESRMESLDRRDTRIDSRVESLDSRLTLLDSRVSELTNHVLRGGQTQQMDELSSRMDSLETRLNKVITQINDHKPEQDEVTATVERHETQLYTIATRLENHETQVAQLITRLDNQSKLSQSQLNQINTQLSEQQSQQENATLEMDNLTARLHSHTAHLESIDSQLESQGSQLAELTSINQSKRTKLTPAKDRSVNQTSTQQAVVDQIDATANLPRDCSDLPAGSTSGIYSVLPSSDYQPVQAYCDMNSAGGGWTVIQRRDDIQPRQDFNLGWAEYKRGFGNLTGEFWWGLENMHQLTASNHTQYELRVELEAFDGDKAYAVYHGFGVSSEDDGYRLRGTYVTGSAGNGLKYAVGRKFTTHDRDQDRWSGVNCAQVHRGAWWYSGCGYSNLNGRHGDSSTWYWYEIWWYEWRRRESLKKAEMKIRPRQR